MYHRLNKYIMCNSCMFKICIFLTIKIIVFTKLIWLKLFIIMWGIDDNKYLPGL